VRRKYFEKIDFIQAVQHWTLWRTQSKMQLPLWCAFRNDIKTRPTAVWVGLNRFYISKIDAEAEYAHSTDKAIVPVRTERYKPTGWLGIMLGSKLYIDCMTVDDANDCALKLSRELGERGKKQQTAVPPPVETEAKPATAARVRTGKPSAERNGSIITIKGSHQ
jgi:hypothetical protein